MTSVYLTSTKFRRSLWVQEHTELSISASIRRQNKKGPWKKSQRKRSRTSIDLNKRYKFSKSWITRTSWKCTNILRTKKMFGLSQNCVKVENYSRKLSRKNISLKKLRREYLNKFCKVLIIVIFNVSPIEILNLRTFYSRLRIHSPI